MLIGIQDLVVRVNVEYKKEEDCVYCYGFCINVYEFEYRVDFVFVVVICFKDVKKYCIYIFVDY